MSSAAFLSDDTRYYAYYCLAMALVCAFVLICILLLRLLTENI
jgi:hypothetical protein